MLSASSIITAILFKKSLSLLVRQTALIAVPRCGRASYLVSNCRARPFIRQTISHQNDRFGKFLSSMFRISTSQCVAFPKKHPYIKINHNSVLKKSEIRNLQSEIRNQKSKIAYLYRPFGQCGANAISSPKFDK